MGRLKTKLFDQSIHPALNTEDYSAPENFDAGGIWYAELTTIAGLQEYMKKHNIPETAWIRYAGCGSHMIEFFWPDPNDEDDWRT